MKNPAEIVASTLKMTGAFDGPNPAWGLLSLEPGTMGQDLLNPPTVEGWHTGGEWINSGALINRVNFVADRLGDTSSPGRPGDGEAHRQQRRRHDNRCVHRPLSL